MRRCQTCRLDPTPGQTTLASHTRVWLPCLGFMRPLQGADLRFEGSTQGNHHHHPFKDCYSPEAAGRRFSRKLHLLPGNVSHVACFGHASANHSAEGPRCLKLRLSRLGPLHPRHTACSKPKASRLLCTRHIQCQLPTAVEGCET